MFMHAQHVHACLCRTGNGASQPTGTGSSVGLRANPTRSSAYFQHTHLDKYMPFMAGLGYVLSSDLAHTVLGFNQEQDSGGHQAACGKPCRVPSLAGTGYELIDRMPKVEGLLQEQISRRAGVFINAVVSRCSAACLAASQAAAGCVLSSTLLLCWALAMEEQQRWRVDMQCGGPPLKASGAQLLQKTCIGLVTSQAAAGLVQKHGGSDSNGSPQAPCCTRPCPVDRPMTFCQRVWGCYKLT